MRACGLILAVLASPGASHAGSLLGADLLYARLEGLTWSFSVITYVDPFAPADMPELFVTIEGSTDTIPRESQTVFDGDCFEQIQRDVYTWQHTFSGPGVHEITAWKVGRVEAANLPTLWDNGLCLSTEILVAGDLVNSSPDFGALQRTSFYMGDVFVHDPQVSDPDGDSLSCWMVLPGGTGCIEMAAFSIPEQSTPLGDTTTVDGATGAFRWFHPNTSGTFSVVMRCIEWRGGIAIGSVIRDMTVCIEAPFTGIEETDQIGASILQPSVDGPVTVRWNDDRGCMIDILDTRGALVQRIRGIGRQTMIPTDQMVPGIHLVEVVDAIGTIITGRFVVAR